MTNLIDRLRTALNEHEQIARAATSGPWRREHPNVPNTSIGNGDRTVIASAAGHRGSWPSPEDAAQITANDPVRALREVQAHRAILDHLVAQLADDRDDATALWMVEQLATIYLPERVASNDDSKLSEADSTSTDERPDHGNI